MKRVLGLALLLLLLVFACDSFAWQTQLNPAYRMYPQSGDFNASVLQDGLLYDQRPEGKSLLFGLWQVKFTGSVAGTVDASIAVYPVSFVRLNVGIGGVERYYNLPTFNCSLVTCQGFVQKNHVGIGLALAAGENHQWIALPEYNQLQISSAQGKQVPLADETELILANPNGDTLDQYSVILARKVETETYGVMLRQAQYRSTGQHNEMQALVAKRQWSDTSLILGVGRWASDMNVPSITAFASYEMHWGTSQALF